MWILLSADDVSNLDRSKRAATNAIKPLSKSSQRLPL